MLVEFLGTNLSKINNEWKLQIILPIGSLITLKILKKIFDSVKTLMSLNCRKAIGERNQLKAYTIAENFANNPKRTPWWLPLV
jgi:DNA polymerase-3 subunit delta